MFVYITAYLVDGKNVRTKFSVWKNSYLKHNLVSGIILGWYSGTLSW